MLRGLTAAKAWIGAALAAFAAASVALEDGHITWSEVPVIVGAFVAGYQGVYWTGNKGTGEAKDR